MSEAASNAAPELRHLEVKEVSNMLLMLAGKLVSLLGSFLYSFVMGLYVLKTTGSAMSFAATLVSGTLPRIILAPFAGALADKLDRKKIVVGMDLASGALMLVLFVVSYLYGLQLIFIYGTAFLLAAANTFLNVALDAAVPNLVSDRNLVRINSLNQGINSLTQIVAPFAGEGCFRHSGYPHLCSDRRGFLYCFSNIRDVY